MKSREQRLFATSIAALVFLAIMAMISGTAFGDKEYSKTLKFAQPVPPGSFSGKIHQWWANELEKRTNGRIKVQFYWMESLVRWRDMLQGVSSGIADLGLPNPTFHPSDLPLFMVTDTVYNCSDNWAGMMAVFDASRNEPNLKAELDRNKLIIVGPWCGGDLPVSTRFKWRSFSELKGKTFRSYGGSRIPFWQNLGVNPITLSFAEIYEAMQRGTIDGNLESPLPLSNAFKLYEVIKQVTRVADGTVVGGSSTAMNLDV